MFNMIVKAQSLPELAKKLQEAATTIKGGCEVYSITRQEQVDAAAMRISNPPAVATRDGFDCSGAQDAVDNSVETVDSEPKSVVINSQAIAQAATAYEVDARGLPYDKRIHSSNKQKNNDGSWRYKRGVDKTIVAQIEAELRVGAVPQSPGIPTAPTANAPVPTPVQIPLAPPPAPTIPVEQPVFTQPPPLSVAPQVAPTVAAPVAPTVATPVSAPTYENIPVPTTTKPAHSLETFKNPANFATTLAKLRNEGKITPEYIEQLKTHFGVKEIFDLPKNDAAIAEVFQTFVKYGFITQVG